MKVLVFDTETTGLPERYNIPYQQSHKWPHIVQFSFILYDLEKNKIINESDFIIDVAKDVVISPESTKIHGITHQISKNQGFDIKDILEIFQVCINAADYVVAHNINFDRNMILAECYRNKLHSMESMFSSDKIYFCTMLRSKFWCNFKAINKKTGEEYVRYPKLIELHEKLFNDKPNNLHNSFIDVIVCLRCFYKMTHKKDLCRVNKRIGSLYKGNCT